MTIFESVARIVESAYEHTRIGYDNNLKAIAYSVFNFKKKSGNYASTAVVFKTTEPVSYRTVVLSGTKISDGSHVFVTQEQGVIEAGESESNSVIVSADKIGTEYNVAAHSLSVIESIVPSVIVSVDNAQKAEGGTDEETDSEMTLRFQKYINGLQGTSYYGLESGVLGIDGVKSVGIQEHIPLVAGQFYNATVYVDDGSGTISSDLKKKVEDVINGDGTSQNPGLRAVGINIEVSNASIVNVNVSCVCKITQTADTEMMKANVESAIKSYVNDLGINDNVVWSQVMNVILSAGVKDVKTLRLNGEAENIPIAVNQIARLGTTNITVEYE